MVIQSILLLCIVLPKPPVWMCVSTRKRSDAGLKMAPTSVLLSLSSLSTTSTYVFQSSCHKNDVLNS